MGNKHKTQVAVYNAEATHGSMPSDFVSAVKDIKLAILQARANAARLANAEALKLYFYVGGYISKKTRSAKWGSGAIDALSNQLQVELPGLRGFSATNIKNMRAFFEFWADDFSIRPLPMGELSIRHLPSDELVQDQFRHLASDESQTNSSIHRRIYAYTSYLPRKIPSVQAVLFEAAWKARQWRQCPIWRSVSSSIYSHRRRSRVSTTRHSIVVRHEHGPVGLQA